MAVQDIAYVDLFTRDPRSAVDYFVSSMGFAEEARSMGAERSSALLRQGTAQLLVTSGPATWRFLSEHGDGIGDIAVTCDDVSETQDAAVAAGARVVGTVDGNPIVSGFGDVTHTLLPARVVSRIGFPSLTGRDWTTVATTPRPLGRIQLLDHIAICLVGGSLGHWADHYRDAFGLARYSSEYTDTGEQGMDSIVVRSVSGRVTFTLVAPDSAKCPGQLDGFLARNSGPGVQHLAFGVDDVIPTVHEFRDRGVEFLSTPDTYYEVLAERLTGMREKIPDLRAAQVLADRDEWGYLLQLFSRSPYERNTLFYELIQRMGSRGFGSANIRALYEAVERDRLASG